MLQYPDIDPVAISLGPLQIHWYGITYLVGISGAWLLARRRAAKPGSDWSNEQVADLVFYAAMGVILGGRIGYMLFYKFGSLLADPLSLFYVWEGGMSFHGGFLGVIIAISLFARNTGKSGFKVLDFVAPVVPIGLGAGRIGNFIGGELWGRASEVPWAMVFPAAAAGGIARHPSQLYQCALEGVVLFIILWGYSSRPRPTFAVAGMFTLFYGLFRFLVEFFRQPDSDFNFIAFNWLTMGQLLSTPMIIAGASIILLAYKNNTFGKWSS
ncbi:prolipoprotein diacylglyceryl transferase [Gammaproteobacteria bacterium]|nr:prolipoprotein diacylglyceryl transferase [Gammaproteobacteria bacterium]